MKNVFSSDLDLLSCYAMYRRRWTSTFRRKLLSLLWPWRCWYLYTWCYNPNDHRLNTQYCANL